MFTSRAERLEGEVAGRRGCRMWGLNMQIQVLLGRGRKAGQAEASLTSMNSDLKVGSENVLPVDFGVKVLGLQSEERAGFWL